MEYKNKIAEYEYLIKAFNEAFKNQDLKQLNGLIEYVRAEGVLYADYYEMQSFLIKLILEISLELLKKPEAQDSNDLWWFICQFYDVVFHQVRLVEYPADCSNIYAELTSNIQDFRFTKLKKLDSELAAYRNCLYFIELME